MLSERAHPFPHFTLQLPASVPEERAWIPPCPAHRDRRHQGRYTEDNQHEALAATSQSAERGHYIHRNQQCALPSISSAHQSDTSEHLLRRKTPNGTLAAGYDGRPGQWMHQAHPPKHLLMSVSESPQPAPTNFQSPASFASQSPARALPSFATRASSQRSCDLSVSSSLNGFPHDVKSSRTGERAGLPAVGLDSVLHQSTLQSYPFNTVNQHSVPTVLQPLWPPCLGPTRLHTPGPVGPYWPNGAFEPYRPAPLRDTRFHNEHQSSGRALYTRPQRLAPLQREQYSHWSFAGPGPKHIPPRCAQPTLRNECTDHRATDGLWTRSLPHDFQLKLGIGSGRSGGSHPSVGDPAVGLSGPGYRTGLGQSGYDLAKASGHVQFKERMLYWAHGIYCTLIASIEASRREGHRSSPQAPAKSSHLPRPRRPYPSWSSNQLQSIPLPSAHGIRDSGIPRNSTVSSNQPHLTLVENHHLAPTSADFQYSPISAPQSCRLGPRQDDLGSPAQPVQHFRSQICSVHPSYVPAELGQAHAMRSPLSAAVNAMEILGRLCQESHWQWLDGMLLNGCLAYGLGNYSKAMKWYTKVLRRDPENVEAMSNLAATLLALGRRQEAEQYWMRSVKQRPSYFEAVEHLVGLLHEEHRGKEAVSVIHYIETALLNRESPCPSAYQCTQRRPRDYDISPSENGRLLALIHGKGNALYQSGNDEGAAKAFEDAILIGTGQYRDSIGSLISHILAVFSMQGQSFGISHDIDSHGQPLLLPPEVALETSRLVFPPNGTLPGLKSVPTVMAQNAAVSIISNSLLSLAKIYQDGMSSSGASATGPRATAGVQEILALYYLSLSLLPSPSTANNVGILLAGVQQPARICQQFETSTTDQLSATSGIAPGSGVALALAYYDYGLRLDSRHAHLYTNLGSLFKDIGQLPAAIKMYEKAVDCDGTFDIALANLANAVKDRGNINDAIHYYKRAVASNPEFAEAVCGLANALNSVCSWNGRGGICCPQGKIDRWHVDEQGLLYDSKARSITSSGWMERVVSIVQKQLGDGRSWGKGVILNVGVKHLMQQLDQVTTPPQKDRFRHALQTWMDECWEGARVVRLIERATKIITWHAYRSSYIAGSSEGVNKQRPQLPAVLAVPSAPTVLPFHTFTCPLSAKQIRLISQRNGLRVSCTTLRAPWLPPQIYGPPPPPNPHLNVGYISSDFNNHPLAHLMQSVFGLHHPSKVRATCYATTASDDSVHRKQIEREAPAFHDCSAWPTERLVNQVVEDQIHVLVNLNGYTRGAKNEVFAARPAPVQISFMGFAGTLGAEWCDYLLADEIAIPPSTLRPYRRNVDVLDQMKDGNNDDSTEGWVYGENIVYTKDTFFCCDHRQSAPDAHGKQISWPEEQKRRWKLRKELFPGLADDAVILANFNQLYKIEPTTFRSWLRILSRAPKAVLWLLRFPELGELHLRRTALQWVGAEVASRLIFTDVAPKQQHITRAKVCDLFIDTPECNAHTTAADVLWSATPLLTYPKYKYKMCSRMAASILRGALPKSPEGDRAAEDLIATSDEAYEEQGVELATDLVYPIGGGEEGFGKGRLMEIRKLLYESRWTSALFDTQRWVNDLETAYAEAWRRWVEGEGGDIWIGSCGST